MRMPDYRGGSLVNLMSSISRALGGKSSYSQLKQLPSSKLKNSRNIILIVLDGIGYEYIKEKGKKTVFQEHLKGVITSVFPSTTASAITTILSGLAPQQHAITGWFVHLKEIGAVTAILPFVTRAGGQSLAKAGVRKRDIMDFKRFEDGLKAASCNVTTQNIKRDELKDGTSKRTSVLGYTNLRGFFSQIKKAVRSSNKRKFVYAYWPGFDAIAHQEGVRSRKAEDHFRQISKELGSFVEGMRGTNTTIIITSDHGMIDTSGKRTIRLEDHPGLKECLTLPLCGEPRAAYCYVHPSKTKQFERYVRKKLGKCCRLYRSEELVKRNFFGLYKRNPRLNDRIGDYTIIMKHDYIIKDRLPGEEERILAGNHGGLSKEEMLVPLAVINL